MYNISFYRVNFILKVSKISFVKSWKFFRSKMTNLYLHKSSWIIIGKIQPQMERTLLTEVLDKINYTNSISLWFLFILGLLFWLMGYGSTFRIILLKRKSIITNLHFIITKPSTNYLYLSFQLK